MTLNVNNIRHWIFDLDNTLYPASCGILEQARGAVMTYMKGRLALSAEQTTALYNDLQKDHHSVLKGLMQQHDISPKEIFDQIQTLDISSIKPNELLSETLKALPGEKIIFTNATRKHAINTLNALGIFTHFDHIYDIETAGYLPKPHPDTYKNLCTTLNISPQHAIYFEDAPHNLKPGFDLGMKTVFVKHNPGSESTCEDYIDHYIDDITEGLRTLSSQAD